MPSSVASSMRSLLEFEAYSKGTVRQWKSGTFKKQPDGSWKRVPSGEKTSSSSSSTKLVGKEPVALEPEPDPEVVDTVTVAMSEGYDHLTDEPSRASTKDYFSRVLDVEAAQTKELLRIAKKIVQRKKITDEESDRAQQQLSDILKVASLASIAAGVGTALVTAGVGTAVAVAAVRGLRYAVTAVASNVVMQMWAKMRDKKTPEWDPLLPTGFYQDPQRPSPTRLQAESLTGSERTFLLASVDAFYDSLAALKPTDKELRKVARLAVLQSAPQLEATAPTVSIRTDFGTVRFSTTRPVQEVPVFQEVNARLEAIVESLDEDRGFDLIFEGLEDAGIELSIDEEADADAIAEAILGFIDSDEFDSLDEEAQGKIKKGFKMVFGKAVKVGKGAGKLAGSIAKHTGKEMDKTIGRRMVKKATITAVKAPVALAAASGKAAAWAARKVASTAADSIRAAGGRQAYNIYKGVKKDMSK